jgi:hypothetical protein
MEVEWGSEFERVLRRVEKGANSGDPVARIRYDHLRALLDELAQLSRRPEAESQGRAVLALFAFDKAKLGDIWYDRATRESEASLDQWRRENPERRGESE